MKWGMVGRYCATWVCWGRLPREVGGSTVVPCSSGAVLVSVNSLFDGQQGP